MNSERDFDDRARSATDRQPDTGVRAEDPPGLDSELLADHLRQELPGGITGELSGRLLTGGRSNLTYEVRDEAGRRWAVRRPPLGHVLPTAHDMAREFRVINALRTTPVPVPEAMLLCRDVSVLGAPFFVMEFVDGHSALDVEGLRELGSRRTGRIGSALVTQLVTLHSVDPEQVGLGDFGRPEGFLARQLRRWRTQLDGSRSRPTDLLDALHTRLGDALPVSPAPTIVHGDYRVDNTIFGDDDRMRAILDWEMATLGDPLADLGMLLVYGRRAPLAGHAPVNAETTPGYPTEDALIEAYATTSGRDVDGLAWYVGFGFFKLAVIMEGIHYRHRLGQTAGVGFGGIGELVEPLARSGHDALRAGLR
ncbi:phosphotransferase family protein [Actinoalloteichus hymeniacidonis]|nr:phosphotransferase family protein [Actinoalloteichus hymeniacidonis]MBB5908635.1 aminoglycoside phosphotransferase (APT) family kinase protein [Actinoalloteichus hymeniacidonis]